MRAASPAPPLPARLGVRLSVMMFLQYAIWGAWLPILWPYLAHLRFDEGEIGTIFAVGAVGAIVAPFIAGQIADRWFATEKFLALSHVLGALLMWQLGSLDSFGAFLAFSLAYSLIYAPTLSLTNSLAFHHLPDRDRDFGKVRLWGTIGWIAVGIGVGQWLFRHYGNDPSTLDAGRADAFKLSAVLGFAMGAYCLLLPRTPPARGAASNAVFEAAGEIKRQPLVTLFVLAVPISCIHQFYFAHTATFLTRYQSKIAADINEVFGAGGGGLMTIGQMSEIVVLGLIPLVAKKVARKTLLGIGIAAYALRMAIFAWVDVLPVPATLSLITGIALHGLCFGCFVFVAFMIVDEETTTDVKASAQSLFNLVIVGVGILAGSYIASGVAALYSVEEGGRKVVTDWTGLWSWPFWGALGCLVALWVFYPRRPTSSPSGTGRP